MIPEIRKNILNTFKKICFVFLLSVIVIVPKFTFADLTNYTTLVSLPEIGDQTNFQEWLPKAFNLTIGIAVALAFVMITIGGVMYATSDAIYSKSEGRKYVENALIGLLFVIGAYVILYTINPQILNIDLKIESPQVSAPAGQTTTTTSTGEVVCSGCGSMTSASIPMKNGIGTSIYSTLLPKMINLTSALKADGINWQVTEGYPPAAGIDHVSACHQTGKCFDANFTDSPTAKNINLFLSEASKEGFGIIYEVKTQAEKDSWVKAGVRSPSILVNAKASAPHFHVSLK